MSMSSVCLQAVILLAAVWNSAMAAGDAAIAVGDTARWAVYKDATWGFSLEYPADWKAEILLENINKPDYVIKRKIAFTGPIGPTIILDLWTNDRDLETMNWFNAFARQLSNQAAEIPKEPNLEVAGNEALQYYNPQQQSSDQLVTVFRKDNLAFRLEYRITDQMKSRSIADHMLASFK